MHAQLSQILRNDSKNGDQHVIIIVVKQHCYLVEDVLSGHCECLSTGIEHVGIVSFVR